MQLISKSLFKSHMLEFLRKVAEDKQPLIITHSGKPVAKVIPYKENPDTVLKKLKGSVIKYEDPFAPVGEKDWEALK